MVLDCIKSPFISNPCMFQSISNKVDQRRVKLFLFWFSEFKVLMSKLLWIWSIGETGDINSIIKRNILSSLWKNFDVEMFKQLCQPQIFKLFFFQFFVRVVRCSSHNRNWKPRSFFHRNCRWDYWCNGNVVRQRQMGHCYSFKVNNAESSSGN